MAYNPAHAALDLVVAAVRQAADPTEEGAAAEVVAQHHQIGEGLLVDCDDEALVSEEGLGLGGEQQVVADARRVHLHDGVGIPAGDSKTSRAVEHDQREGHPRDGRRARPPNASTQP